ncbi:hypothetical protein HDV06_006779 [Boothiomyces sp. JEL0866]|nr:hypothetical protein HDV06_006779 [Boothiomyces sp. JEL0866]
MSRQLGVDLLWLAIMSILFGISSYHSYHINSKKNNVKSFIPEFNCLLGFNVLQCLLMMFWIILYYLDYDIWQMNDANIILSSGVVVSLQIFMIFITDVEILRVFSVLTERITEYRLLIFKRIVMVLYVAVFVCSLLPFFNHSDQVGNLADAMLGLFALLVVVYDNIQAFSLAFLIYWYKRNMGKSDLDAQIKLFKTVIKFNLFILMMDWLGLFFYAYSLINDSQFDNSVMVSLTCISIHTLGMVHILKMFTLLSVQQKKAAPVRIAMNMADTIHL